MIRMHSWGQEDLVLEEFRRVRDEIRSEINYNDMNAILSFLRSLEEITLSLFACSYQSD